MLLQLLTIALHALPQFGWKVLLTLISIQEPKAIPIGSDVMLCVVSYAIANWFQCYALPGILRHREIGYDVILCVVSYAIANWFRCYTMCGILRHSQLVPMLCSAWYPMPYENKRRYNFLQGFTNNIL